MWGFLPLIALILLAGCVECPTITNEEICAMGEEFYGEEYYYNKTLDMCVEKPEPPFIDYTKGQSYESSGWHKVNCSICGGQVWSDGCNHHICSEYIGGTTCSSTLVMCMDINKTNFYFEGGRNSSQS